MRRLVIGLATVSLVAVGMFGAPRVEAQPEPEGCLAVHPVGCEYEASRSGGCLLVGTITINIYELGGTLVETQHYTSETPDIPCEGVGSDSEPRLVEVIPETPGTVTFVGSEGVDEI